MTGLSVSGLGVVRASVAGSSPAVAADASAAAARATAALTHGTTAGATPAYGAAVAATTDTSAGATNATAATTNAATSTTYDATPVDSEDNFGGMLEGITLTRPFEIVPNLLTNAVAQFTGTRDKRHGAALADVIMAGERLVTAHLSHVAQGSGIVAAGSSVLGKVLPLLSIGAGAMQVMEGWNELQSHDEGPLSIIHSKKGRSGLLSAAAGVLLFVPGVGAILGGAATRLVAAANEMDVFSFLDEPTVAADEKNVTVARIAHPLDRTPLDPHDSPGPLLQKEELGDIVGNIKKSVANLIG